MATMKVQTPQEKYSELMQSVIRERDACKAQRDELAGALRCAARVIDTLINTGSVDDSELTNLRGLIAKL